LLLVLLLIIRWLDPLHGLGALAGIVLLALLVVVRSVANGPEGEEPRRDSQGNG
jgi:hypothetical protein